MHRSVPGRARPRDEAALLDGRQEHEIREGGHAGAGRWAAEAMRRSAVDHSTHSSGDSGGLARALLGVATATCRSVLLASRRLSMVCLNRIRCVIALALLVVLAAVGAVACAGGVEAGPHRRTRRVRGRGRRQRQGGTYAEQAVDGKPLPRFDRGQQGRGRRIARLRLRRTEDRRRPSSRHRAGRAHHQCPARPQPDHVRRCSTPLAYIGTEAVALAVRADSRFKTLQGYLR